MKPRLLDLFCGAGGCTKGYQRAGFYVVGVDINPQPNYCGDEFVQDDALALMSTYPWWDVEPFDVVHASPPCQAFSFASLFHGNKTYVDSIPPTRERLEASGVPYVIENVPGAPIRKDLLLCGEMFGLRLHRHRYFELGNGAFVMSHPHTHHHLKGAEHNCHIEEGFTRQVAGNYADHESASEAMGIGWMTRDELAQAIPPAYTEHIGHQLMDALRYREAA